METLNQAMTLKINKFNPETGQFIESVEFISGSTAEYRLDVETRKEITSLIESELQEKYQELLMAVTAKHPIETRHETALRYIKQAGERTSLSGSQSNPN